MADAADNALVEAARGGDTQAFRQLYEKYQRRAFAVALGVLKDPSEATDVVQDAFVKVHRHLARFEGQSAFYTWLYRIVMNLSIDRLRKRRVHLVELDEGRIEADSDAPDAAPSRAALNKELGAAIAEALETLPEHHRAVLVLREIEGMDYETIAETLNIPKGTVMSRLFHARRRMQEALKPYLLDEGQAAAPDGDRTPRQPSSAPAAEDRPEP